MLCEVFFSSFPGDTNACMRMFPALTKSYFPQVLPLSMFRFDKITCMTPPGTLLNQS